MIKLKYGDNCPDFSLKDQNSNEISLKDYSGSKLLIYFYPRANTPGCTEQSCQVRNSKEDFSKIGVKVVGISPDNPSRQKKFESNYNLNFPLLCDTEHKVAEAFGVWQEKKMFGKTYMGIVRSSFLIDENAKIIEAWYKVKPEETVPKALAAMNAL